MTCRLLLTGTVLFLFNPVVTGQKPVEFRDSTTKTPQTFAIIVGISKYKFVRPLTYADKDAELFRDYLKSPGGGSVKEDNIFCLLNEQAHNLNFWGKGFQWLKAKKLQRGDKLFIYLAGHGDAIDEDQFFFLGYDCNPGGDKNNYLVSGAIQLFNLKKKIADETSRGVEVIFIMDACRSDELPGGTAGQNFLNSAVTEKKAGEIIMLATGAGQESLEDASIGNGHGLFTWYLVDGLTGAADSIQAVDQQVTFEEIQTYVSRHVPEVARQRFRRTQEPFFCCNENSDKVISRVNRDYYLRWKSRNRGPGNSFTGSARQIEFRPADTLLQETYNRFNAAIRNNRFATAEDYYRMLNKKFPASGYTLDARSTLAVRYAESAQKMVDDFVSCQVLPANRRNSYAEAAEGLEKAIGWFREDDADFANSLYGRLFLLRALGSQSPELRLSHAHAARAFEPNGAYGNYILASLHLEGNRNDSANLYAEKAVSLAPNWPCAVSLLALARNNSSQPGNNNPGKFPVPKPRVGIMIAGGANQPAITREETTDPTIIGIEGGNKAILEGGVTVDIPLTPMISFRPVLQASLVKGEIVYQRRLQTGGPIFTETVNTEYTAINLPLGFLVRFGNKNVRPYIAVAPVPSYALLKEPDTERFKNFSLLGEASLGVELSPGRGKIRVVPELRFNRAITNQKSDQNTLNGVKEVRKQSFLFTLYLMGN